MNDFDFIEDGYVPGSYDFYFGTIVTVYSILNGLSNNFTSVWASTDAGLYTGKVYVSSSDAFNIINNTTNTVEDYYTETHVGAAGEALQSNDIVDTDVV